MITKLKIVRDKLQSFWPPIIDRELIQKIIKVDAPWYRIADLCSYKLITPLKKWKIYLNLLSRKFVNPYIIWALFFENKPYVFWWLQVNNAYHFTSQVPERYTLYNTAKSSKKIIWNAKFIFKKVRPSFFYGVKKQTIDWLVVNIMTPERALIQMIREWASLEFVQTFPDNVDKNKILRMAKNYTNKKVLEKIKMLIHA